MTGAMTRGGIVFHTVVSASQVDGMVESPMFSNEAWIDLTRDHTRLEFRKAPGFASDLADYNLSVLAEGKRYSDDGDLRPSVANYDDYALCINGPSPWVVRRLACGFMDYPASADVKVDTSAKYEGREVVVLTTRSVHQPEPGAGQHGTPAPGDPDPTKPTALVYRLFVDRTTFLPIASVAEVEQAGVVVRGGVVVRFKNDFVRADSLASDFLEPSAVGYVDPGDRQKQLLDDPASPVPVYWLGRSFDPGNGLPVLKLAEVDGRSRVPGAGPWSALALSYASSSGSDRVQLDL